MKTKKIKDCLPLVNGIWTKIDYQFPEIFDIDASQLDVLFLSNWSMRTAAPILNVLHADESTSMLTQEELTQLAEIINGMYKHRWDKLMAVAEMEYDPIHNFSDHLVESIEYTEGVDGSKSSSGSRNDTRTDNLSTLTTDRRSKTDTFNTTDTETDNLSNTETLNKTITETRNMNNSGSNSNQDNVYGFNSSTAVGERNNSGTNSNLESGTIADAHTGTVTNAKTGTVANAKTGTVTSANDGTLTEANTGTQTNAGTSSNSETSSNDTEGEKTREYTKTGNIGNISTQKLMNEEIELWKYNFIHEIMRDVANFVSLPIYEQ